MSHLEGAPGQTLARLAMSLCSTGRTGGGGWGANGLDISA